MKCSETPLGQVQVWDRFIRIFHWSLVALVPLAFFSHGGLRDVHRWTGYAILFLVAARVIWGFYGGQHARFANFVPNLAGLVHYLGQVMRRKEPRTLGHNPAGAAMVMALLLNLLGIVATGMLLDTARYRDDRPLLALHDGLSDVLLVLIMLHLMGMLYTSVRHRENLILSMVTGRKNP